MSGQYYCWSNLKKLLVLIGLAIVHAGSWLPAAMAGDEIIIHSYRASDYLTKQTKEVKFSISMDKYAALPAFDPQSSKVPLSIEVALQKAWDSIGDQKASVHLQDVRLMNTYEYFPEKKAIWFYIVTFRDNKFGPRRAEAVILLDGTVVRPRVSVTSEAPSTSAEPP